MRILYLDCFSGISGDMFLGALIDAGADAGQLESHLRQLPLDHWRMEVSSATNRGITGTRVKIAIEEEHQPHRHFSSIRDLIAGSSLPEGAKQKALKVFQRLAEAEGKVHGLPADHVHFHEVGAVDSIIDIVGAALALDLLGVEEVACSPVPPGSGRIKCSHGILPVPAPATAELLRGVPLVSLDVEGELVTPTGAALATTFTGAFGPMPGMTVEAVGYGLGSRDYGLPNFLRVFLGSRAGGGQERESDTILVLETNIDDLNPQIMGHVTETLLSAGALDVFITPVHMKKNRPGFLLTVLCRPRDREVLLAILFEETSTLGVRFREERRAVLDRRAGEVDTPYGRVGIKCAVGPSGQVIRSAPEFEECKKLAREKGISVRRVYEAALAATLTGIK